MTTPSTDRQVLIWWGVLLVALGGLLGAGVTHLAQRQAAPAADAPPRDLDVLGTISDFSLTERSGKPITRSDLAGRVAVVDFIFTACASTCPIMTGRMAELQRRLGPGDAVQLVSISVDPERDDPERLRAYADKVGADGQRWWFLTGNKSDIYRLSHESFRLTVEEVAEEERTPDMEAVLHSIKFVLLDKRTRIRGYYDGTSADDVERLYLDIRRLLDE